LEKNSRIKVTIIPIYGQIFVDWWEPDNEPRIFIYENGEVPTYSLPESKIFETAAMEAVGKLIDSNKVPVSDLYYSVVVVYDGECLFCGRLQYTEHVCKDGGTSGGTFNINWLE
jgi:hypothetical protein